MGTLSAGRAFDVGNSYGYRQQPDIPQTLDSVRDLKELFINPETTYFLSRVTLDITDRPVMPQWQKQLFQVLSRTSNDPSLYFQLPPEQVVEIGVRLPL